MKANALSHSTLLLYTTALTGCIRGSLLLEFYRYAQKEHIKLIVVKSTGDACIDSVYLDEHIDGVIAFPYSISRDLVKSIQALDLPLISIGSDYFPLEVESFLPDYRSVMEDVRWHFDEFNITNIGYVGDMKNNHHRLIFHALQGAYQHNKPNLLPATGSLVDAGAQVYFAQEWKQQDKEGLMFASDLMAVGFIKAFKENEDASAVMPAIIGVGNSIMGSEKPFWLTSIDLNYAEFVRRTIDRIRMLNQGGGKRKYPQYVELNLVVRNSSERCTLNMSEVGSFSFDYQEFNLASPAVQYGHESPIALASKGLSRASAFSTLYGPCYDWGYLGHCRKLQDNTWEVRLRNIERQIGKGGLPETVEETHTFEQGTFYAWLQTLGELCDDAVIRCIAKRISATEFECMIVCNNQSSKLDNARLSLFDNYLEIGAQMPFLYQESPSEDDPEKSASAVSDDLVLSKQKSWCWNMDTNEIQWCSDILALFSVPNQETQMPGFFEYIHQDDEVYIRGHLKAHLEADLPFSCQFRVVCRNQQVQWIQAKGESYQHPVSKNVIFEGEMSLINPTVRTANGMLDRAAFYELLALKSQQSNQQKKAALISIDINNYKNVLHTFGAEDARVFQRRVAQVLLEVLCKEPLFEESVFASLTDTTFGVLLDVESEQHIGEITERLLAVSTQEVCLRDENVVMSLTMGVATMPDDAITYSEALACSLFALNWARKNQHKEFCRYVPSLKQRKKHGRFSLESSLRKAIQNDELRLFYQPQMDINQHQLVGVEALVRWESPTLGLVSPGDFIPVAEQSGLIHKLGDWVLSKAISDKAHWNKLGPFQGIDLSINVASGQLADVDLANRIMHLARLYDVSPNEITLEITESATIVDIKHTLPILTQLRESGFKLALDDFGTGYSSLSQLKQIPLDCVKIDRTFVSEIDKNQTDVDIVRAIYMMCRALGYKVVCEGVESETQLSLIKGIGIDTIQGFYFERPLPKIDFESKYLVNA